MDIIDRYNDSGFFGFNYRIKKDKKYARLKIMNY